MLIQEIEHKQVGIVLSNYKGGATAGVYCNCLQNPKYIDLSVRQARDISHKLCNFGALCTCLKISA